METQTGKSYLLARFCDQLAIKHLELKYTLWTDTLLKAVYRVEMLLTMAKGVHYIKGFIAI